MAKTIQTSIDQVKNWLVLNSSAVPFIAAYGLRQWSEGVYQRYPDNVLLHFCGIRYTRAGAEVQFFCNQADYYDSFHKIINDQKTLEKIYGDFCADEKNLRDFIRTIEERGMVFLHEHYKEFIDLYDQEYISGVPIDGILVYSEEFFPAMKKKYPSHEPALETLIKPYGETFVGRYHARLLKAALKLNKNFGDAAALLANEEALQEIKEIQKLFFWIKNSYKNTEPLSLDFFAQELLEMMQRGSEANRNEEKILSEELTKHRAECERIAAERIFSDEDYEKLLWFGKIAWWVDRRKEYNLIANYYIAEHLKFLCAEHALKYDEACFLLPREMEEIVSGSKTITDFPIIERQKECTHLHDMYGNDEMLIGEESYDLWEKVSHIEMTATNELKGMCGQRGQARGRVRVIMDAHNASDFNEGDILVTGMTRPDYLSLMKKAAAFITDEGGITCHAAIVARELKKPCVIGTKIATRVLQDGDLVEVDADNGIIKIIINAEDNLVNRFLSDIKGSVIFPPINGYSLYIYSSEFNSRKYIEPIWGLGMDKYDCLSISNGSEMSVYIAEEVFLELADRAFSKHLREPGYGQSLYDLMNSYVPAIKDLYRKCTYSFVDSHKEEEVIEVLLESIRITYTLNAVIAFSIVFDKEICWSLIRKNDFQISKTEFEAIWERAVELVDVSFDRQQKIEALSLLKKGYSLEDLVEPCQYFYASYREVLSRDTVLEKLRDEYGPFDSQLKIQKALDEITSEENERKKIFIAWYSGLSTNQKIITDFCQIVMKIRDQRKNHMARGLTIIWRVAEKFFIQAGIDHRFIRHVIPLYELAQGPAVLRMKREEIKKREDGYICLAPYEGGIYMSYDDVSNQKKRMDDIYSSAHIKNVNNDGNVIKGQVGSKGNAQGKAKIVLNIGEGNKFIAGDILVTGMTRPEFVPLMKQAAAVVTNEGGITCHAAIICRELGIPCVIGTKIATHVLRDGDLVEVDADQGIVRILKDIYEK